MLSGMTASNESAAETGGTRRLISSGHFLSVIAWRNETTETWRADRQWRAARQEQVCDMKIMNSCEGERGDLRAALKGSEGESHWPAHQQLSKASPGAGGWSHSGMTLLANLLEAEVVSNRVCRDRTQNETQTDDIMEKCFCLFSSPLF